MRTMQNGTELPITLNFIYQCIGQMYIEKAAINEQLIGLQGTVQSLIEQVEELKTKPAAKTRGRSNG